MLICATNNPNIQRNICCATSWTRFTDGILDAPQLAVNSNLECLCLSFTVHVCLSLLSFLISLDFWDTAGQERFSSMHPSYYHQAHSCLLVSCLSQQFASVCQDHGESPILFKNIRVIQIL